MDETLEFTVALGLHQTTLSLGRVVTLAPEPGADVVLPAELEAATGTVEPFEGRALVRLRRPTRALLDGRPVEARELSLAPGQTLVLGGLLLTPSQGPPASLVGPPDRAGSGRWSQRLVDTQSLLCLRDPADPAHQTLRALHAIGTLAEAASPSTIAREALDIVVEVTRASRAALVWDGAGVELRRIVRRAPADPPGAWAELDLARVRRAMSSRAAVVSTAKEWGGRRAQAYLPLRGPGPRQVVGALFLERERHDAPLTELEVELATILGRYLVLTLERTEARRELERRRQDLERAHARLASVLDALPEGIAIVGRDGSIEAINAAARERFGEAVPRRGSALLRTFAVADDVRRALAGERVPRRDVTLAGSGGTFEVGAAPVPRAGGPADAAVVTFRDVSDERAREAHLRHTERLRTLGETLAGVAHELNNPLTGVLGHAQLLAERCPDELRGPCARLLEDAERCARLAREVLSFSRAGPREDAPFSLREAMARTAQLLGPELRAYRVALESRVEDVWVRGDARQVQQVLVNLGRNAIQAIAESAATARRVQVASAVEGGRVRVTVEDTGPGPSPEARARLFTPFFTTRAEGTGLGLSLSAKIVADHGGRIECRAEPGRTTFCFDLPLSTVSADASDRGATSRARLLVVDADPRARASLAAALSQVGHNVDAVGTGAEALARSVCGRYDVVLVDDRVPGGGRELLRLLALGALGAHAVLMVAPAGTEVPSPPEGTELLHKPFSEDAVLGLIARALGRVVR